MALKMLLNSAFTQVFGNSTDGINSVKVVRTNVVEEESMKKMFFKDVPGKEQREIAVQEKANGFQMPLHYPKFKKSDYVKMNEWRIDLLLQEYGLSFKGTLDEKRVFAMGAFLWPDQL